MNGELKKVIEHPGYDKTFLNKVPSLKLKYQVSQSTHLDVKTMSSKILNQLNEKKYTVTEERFNSLSFTYQPTSSIWRFKDHYTLGGGKFEFVESGKGHVVNFTYFINILNFLAITVIAILFLLFQEAYLATLIFGIFFLMAGIHQYITTKIVGKKLLRDILKVANNAREVAIAIS